MTVGLMVILAGLSALISPSLLLVLVPYFSGNESLDFRPASTADPVFISLRWPDGVCKKPSESKPFGTVAQPLFVPGRVEEAKFRLRHAIDLNKGDLRPLWDWISSLD